jgi:glycosyltransferase involved in cell wall biosynthesis
LKEEHFDAIIAEYSMMGQYIEANYDLIPADTTSVISVHECYTKAFELRAERGEDIGEDTIKELFSYEFKMYGTADKILTLTKEDADILVNYNYATNLKNKISVVPHGVDTGFYTPFKEKSWKRNTKNILYIGNFQHYPNIDAVKNFINHCWEKVLEEVPDARFYAIGFNPPQELLDLRSDNIIVQEGGDNENVRRFYWNSDVFVAPIALGTGFRGKLLEAMACGLPVVATSLATFGINPIHGKEMFVSDNYDDTFSEYVITLLKDAELRKSIAINALALARRFDHRHAAEKLEQVLKGGK